MAYLADRLRAKVSDVGDVALGAGAVGAGALALAPRQISKGLLQRSATGIEAADKKLGAYSKRYGGPRSFDAIPGMSPKEIKAFKARMRKNDPKLFRQLRGSALRSLGTAGAALGTHAIAKSPIARLGLGALSVGMGYSALKD